MADKLLIVHGYSDGYVQKNNSFAKLRDFLVAKGGYARTDIHFVEYASMDDQSTFEDFADKLDTDYAFIQQLQVAQGRLELTIRAQCPSNEITYAPTTFTVHDASKSIDDQPVFLYPNTTTLVEIILNRHQSDKILNIVKQG